jgi:hypothetical protein
MDSARRLVLLNDTLLEWVVIGIIVYGIYSTNEQGVPSISLLLAKVQPIKMVYGIVVVLLSLSQLLIHTIFVRKNNKKDYYSSLLLACTFIQLFCFISIAIFDMIDYPWQHFVIAGLLGVITLLREFINLEYRNTIYANAEKYKQLKLFTNCVYYINAVILLIMCITGPTYFIVLLCNNDNIERETNIAICEYIFFLFTMTIRKFSIFDIYETNPCL